MPDVEHIQWIDPGGWQTDVTPQSRPESWKASRLSLSTIDVRGSRDCRSFDVFHSALYHLSCSHSNRTKSGWLKRLFANHDINNTTEKARLGRPLWKEEQGQRHLTNRRKS
jgi:hypothetical protein